MCISGIWVVLGRGRYQVNHPLAATERIRDTIIHEMCHAANWIIDGTKRAGHGKLWKAWSVPGAHNESERGKPSYRAHYHCALLSVL